MAVDLLFCDSKDYAMENQSELTTHLDLTANNLKTKQYVFQLTSKGMVVR